MAINERAKSPTQVAADLRAKSLKAAEAAADQLIRPALGEAVCVLHDAGIPVTTAALIAHLLEQGTTGPELTRPASLAAARRLGWVG